MVVELKKLFNDYLDNKLKLEKWQYIGIFCLVMVFSGIFGWIYEVILYYFDGGCKEIYMQGGNFLPWINIYAFGSIIIMFLTHKVKRNPWLVFLLSFISTGIFEYLSGLAIYELMDGLRLWDYNVEIWNYGNINGFVCLRSVSFFAVSGSFLVYFIVPFCIYLSTKMSKKTFLILSVSLLFIIMFDELYNLIFARILNLPRASDVYKSMGFKYVSFK